MGGAHQQRVYQAIFLRPQRGDRRKSRWQLCHADAGRPFRHQGTRGRMEPAAAAASHLGGGFRGIPGATGIAGDHEIEPLGGSVRVTMTESHRWDVPDAILAGGRQGWPFILSSLKSVLETGNPIAINVPMGPPKGMIDAIRQAIATKPWRDVGSGR